MAFLKINQPASYWLGHQTATIQHPIKLSPSTCVSLSLTTPLKVTHKMQIWCSDVSSPDDTSLVGSTRIVYPANFSFPISFVPWYIHPMDGWSHWFFRSCAVDVMTLQGRFTPTIPERSDILSHLFLGCIIHLFC